MFNSLPMLLIKIYSMFLHCQKLELVAVLIKQRIEPIDVKGYIMFIITVVFSPLCKYSTNYVVLFVCLFSFFSYSISLYGVCLFSQHLHGFSPITPLVSVTVKNHAHRVSRRLQSGLVL